MENHSNDKLTDKNELIKMSRVVKNIVRILASILALIFGYLKLKGIPIVPIVSDISADIILKISLSLYYLSWVFGNLSDLNDQEIVYTKAPRKGRIPFFAIGVILIIAVTFGLLCWVNSFQKFTIILTLFWCINIVGWRYMVSKILKSTIQESVEYYQNKNLFVELEKLEIVKNHITGKWQIYRFISGSILLIFIDLLAFTNIPYFISSSSSFVSPDSISS